jgi:hypothetical protein
MVTRSHFYRRVAWLPAVWLMAAMAMTPTVEAQGAGRVGAVGRQAPAAMGSGRAMSWATATLTVSAFVVSAMQVSLIAEGDEGATGQAARPAASSGAPRRMVLIVNQANDGSSSYTLLAAMRAPRQDEKRGRDGVTLRQIGEAHASGRAQSLAESGVTEPDRAQGGSLDGETMALIAIPN